MSHNHLTIPIIAGLAIGIALSLPESTCLDQSSDQKTTLDRIE